MDSKPRHAGPAPTLKIEVDARDLPRRLLHSRIEVPCQPGKLKLWYPKWVPGTHGPCGPVQNVGGLAFRHPTASRSMAARRARALSRRMRRARRRARGHRPPRHDLQRARRAAAGYLTYGNNLVGIINWGTCVMYPEGFPCDDIQASLSLRLPAKWQFATALKSEGTKDGLATFQTVSLTDLVDCPLIAGEHLRTIPLATGPYPPAFLDLVSESPTALELSPKVVEIYSRVVREAGKLIGTCHYPDFHFLVTCSDDLGYLGLEHLTSSINGVRERDLIEDARRKGWVANLLPHEYIHSWCGKFRRPAGMCTPDFQTPMKTRLLWVYEGLAEYLGEVLMVRSGLLDLREFRERLASTIGSLSHHEGRRWRSLEDTGVASHAQGGQPQLGRPQARSRLLLRGDAGLAGSRRDHPRANERQEKPRRFLPQVPGRRARPRPRSFPTSCAEIVKDLQELADFDWESFLLKRVAQPLDELPLEVVGRCGYKIQYSTRAPGEQMSRQNRGGGGVSARDSIGLSFDGDGTITEIVAGGIGDRAGLRTE